MQDFRQNPDNAPAAPNTAPVSDYRQAYQSTAIEENLFAADEDAAELAGPWQRIAARLLDMLPFFFSGIIAAVVFFFFQQHDGVNEATAIAILFLFAGYIIYQIVLMTRHGQTLGKKLMGIRVVTLDGDNPGFVKYVLLREFVYNLILNIVGLIPLLGLLATLGAFVACLVMLFLEDRDRRTLQDLLAGTLVVKA